MQIINASDFVADDESRDAVSYDLMIELDEDSQGKGTLPCGCRIEVGETMAGVIFCLTHS